jgi:hypothetical protein
MLLEIERSWSGLYEGYSDGYKDVQKDGVDEGYAEEVVTPIENCEL